MKAHFYKFFPWSLLWLRVLLGPVIIFMSAAESVPNSLLASIVCLALLTDIFDGILARRFGTATELLRRADCWADNFFWLCAGFALFNRFPEAFIQIRYLVIAFLVMEVSTELFHFYRFGRESSIHSLIAKSFGLALLAAFGAMLLFGGPVWLLIAALSLGIISQLERMVITGLLREQESDIPGIRHALQRRRGEAIKRNRLFN
ncbi:MAG: CDP-alcohol phosphatidyltransferase family protein [Bacteroidota bacterium]